MAAVTVRDRNWKAADTIRVIVFVVTMLFYLIPLLSAAVFGFTLPGHGFTLQSLHPALAETGFWTGVVQTIELAILTSVVSIALLLPTLIWLHLRSQRLLAVAEGLSLIPFVVPPVALVTGANIFFRAVFPSFLVSVYSLVPFYVILALPLVFRALDSGIRAIDIRTLMDASHSLGAGSIRTILQIIQPNVRSAILVAALLSSSMAIGEYAVASLLLHSTFPVLVAVAGQTAPRAAAALSFIAIVATWLLMLLLSVVSRSHRHIAPADAGQAAGIDTDNLREGVLQ
ncbi:ABC transporter permease [Flexivirga caeni]|uniref:ABC transporter permease n=1 Tax=Flexivirga caeni TaxID=2294115 RepID=A0A3M9M1H0_9MICO|nr:ABC transporter permease [Flexivirga caeni]RNI18995.1 ABC transporter permease [Flexivirga caeni]